MRQFAGKLCVKLLALLAALAVLAIFFVLIVRPWYRSWGATPAETRMALSSDGIIPNAIGQETRAITIHAASDRVWPWVAQLGQDRSGFYSYDLLENIVGCEMPTEDRLDPKKQVWRIGDKLWMYPADKAGGMGYAILRDYVFGRALGFAARSIGTSIDQPEDGSWSFALVPVDSAHTRLIVRGRGAAGRSLLGRAFDGAVFEPMHFAMERRLMLGIKELSETGKRNRAANHVEVALWTVMFALLLLSAGATLRREQWLPPLVAFALAGLLFQLLTLGQPPLWVGFLSVSVVASILWIWPHRRPATAESKEFPTSMTMPFYDADDSTCRPGVPSSGALR